MTARRERTRIGFALAGCVFVLGACAPRMAIAPTVTAADCAEIAVWSNGVHTSLSVPVAIPGEDHPIRGLAPGAAHVLVGWGDAAFYQANDAGFWLGVRALIPPSPGAVHVIGSDAPPETWFLGTEAPRFGVTREGAAGLAQFLDDAIARGPNGAPVVLGPGHAGEGSVFVAATEGFHAFNVCNRWTARALRMAGVEVTVGPGWRADALTAQIRGLPRCPGGEDFEGRGRVIWFLNGHIWSWSRLQGSDFATKTPASHHPGALAMTLLEIANELIAGCREGRVRANLDLLYAPDAVSVEAADMGGGRETHGLPAIHGKHDWWEGAFVVHDLSVEGPFVHGEDRFAVVFAMETENKATGERRAEREVAVYHVADGKIVREEFFYPV